MISLRQKLFGGTKMIFGINAWIFWLILAAIFIVIEVSTVNLVSIWFALGSFAALRASLFGADVATQIVLAVVLNLRQMRKSKWQN